MNIKKTYENIDALEKRLKTLADEVKDLEKYAQDIERFENENEKDGKKILMTVTLFEDTLKIIENTAEGLELYTDDLAQDLKEYVEKANFDINEALELYKKDELHGDIMRDLISARMK